MKSFTQSISKKLSYFAMVFLFLLINSFHFVHADNTVIRIGITKNSPLAIKHSDGRLTGYAIDYLKEIKKYNPNWRYQFVFGSYENLLKQLRDKKLDIVPVTQYNAKMEGPYRDSNPQSGFSYSVRPIGQINSVLYTKENNKISSYDDADRLTNLRIGFIRNSAIIEQFDEFIQNQHNTSYRAKNSRFISFYPNLQVLMHALMMGEVDAIATQQLVHHNGLRTMLQFGSTPFYLLGSYDSEIMPALNRAISLIKIDASNFEKSLYKKYFPTNATSATSFLSSAESLYVSRLPEIKVGFLLDSFPVSGIDEKTGELVGINEDIVKLVFEKAGLKLKMVPLEKGEKPADAIKVGRCDMVAGVVHENFINRKGTILSDPFLTAELAIAAKRGYSFNPNAPQVIAINKSFEFLQKYIAEKYPHMTILITKGLIESLKAVQSGQADIIMQNTYALHYHLQNPRYDDLQIIPTTFTIEHIALVANSSTFDPKLMSIINKAIKSLSKDDINSVVNFHTIANPYQLTEIDAIYKYRIPLILCLLLVIVCLGSAVLIIILRQRNLRSLNKKNMQLADAVLHAKHASQAKGQFLANMSHEIRTPLNAIVGMTTLAEQHFDSPTKMHEYLKKIMLSSKILLNLINDILDMSAIENEKLKLSKVAFNFKEMIVSLSTLYYGECKNKGLTFDLLMKDVSEEILIGDSLRVHQILLNLLSNAVKFTPEGGKVRLSISETRNQEHSIFLRFTVSDTGEGIAPELLPRLFNPFEQEDATTARKHGGSGLGLSITKNLVTLMHGSISVESIKNKGTTFTVDLPFEVSDQRPQFESGKFKTIRALIVDDDLEAREYSSIVLERLGIEHKTAESGEQALSLIKQAHDSGNGFDICFIDWKMPKMDGMETTLKIRQLYDDDTIIIIVSAYDIEEIQEPSLSAGANMFVTKPLFQSTVFNLLLSLSNKHSVHYTSSTDQYLFKDARILLVEDNALNTEIAIELLKTVGLNVEHATNGQEAVEMFKNKSPNYYDLILMDIQMPVMDGYEATRNIRRIDRIDAQRIPIYAMTANAFTEDITASLSSGMNGHISKPIDTDVLYSTIAKHIKNTKEN